MSDKNKKNTEKRYVFGPVPSRRLGLSLGVDIIPFKVCPLDCVYCQLGRTTEKTIERSQYAPIEDVLAELKTYLDRKVQADYITLSGSGEPTLHSRLGELIEKIKSMTDIPVAVLTNGVLFYDESVRADCSKADLVLPSLDGAGQEEFEKINRPYAGISIENVVAGLSEFRRQYKGRIWLEVFIVEGFNTEAGQIAKIKSAIAKIKPDKIQLNSVARPTADNNIKKVDSKRLLEIANQLGQDCEIITPGNWGNKTSPMYIGIKRTRQDVLDMLRRRPCSLEDLCRGLGLVRNEAVKYIESLQNEGLIQAVETEGIVYFKSL
ncbi:MAG: radical SAM protein [Sedimentisphaerales bacterium]|nr:radical SAM protein [Sedimentisphaerales bacterium]